MDIGKSFTFPFEDKQWITKLGLGGLITFIPILNFAWTGYTVELIRNVMNDAPEPLPNWDDFGKKLTDGLILALASLIYALPIIAVFCLPMGFMIVPALLSGNSDMQGIADAAMGLGSAVFFCLLCVFAIYALALSVVYPAILVLYAREGNFAACFKFRDILDLIQKNSSPFFTAWAVNLGASFGISLVVGIAQSILSIIPCIGWIAAFVLSFGVIVYITSVSSHLFGQFGRMAFATSPTAINLPQ